MKSSPPTHSFVRGRRGGNGLVFFPLTKSDLLLSQCEQRRLPPGPVDRSEEASLEACSFSPVGGGSVDSHLRVTRVPPCDLPPLPGSHLLLLSRPARGSSGAFLWGSIYGADERSFEQVWEGQQ